MRTSWLAVGFLLLSVNANAQALGTPPDGVAPPPPAAAPTTADVPAAKVFRTSVDLVALSVVVIWIAATVRSTLPYAAIAALFAIGGAIHGYALGESIVGAESSSSASSTNASSPPLTWTARVNAV